jgi:hypothetical protein
MSVLSWLKNEAHILEADVQKIIAAIIKEEHVAIADLEKGLSYVASITPSIVSDLADVAAFVELLAPVAPQAAAVAASLDAAKTIVQGLQAFSDKYNQAVSGGGIPASQAAAAVLAGYQTYKSAQATLADIAAKAATKN